MKNYFAVILIAALFTTADLSAQQMYARKADKKEWKTYKKESKVGRKMFRDRPNAAARKSRKAHKKLWKMEYKDDRSRY